MIPAWSSKKFEDFTEEDMKQFSAVCRAFEDERLCAPLTIQKLEQDLKVVQDQLDLSNQLIADHKKFLGFTSLSSMALLVNDGTWTPMKTESAKEAMRKVRATLLEYLDI